MLESGSAIGGSSGSIQVRTGQTAAQGTQGSISLSIGESTSPIGGSITLNSGTSNSEGQSGGDINIITKSTNMPTQESEFYFISNWYF